jgi:hypothetical protein
MYFLFASAAPLTAEARRAAAARRRAAWSACCQSPGQFRISPDFNCVRVKNNRERHGGHGDK